MECKCLSCNKNYQQNFDEKFYEPSFNTYKFSNHDNRKFSLFLQKDFLVLEKLNETLLPEKKKILYLLKNARYHWCRQNEFVKILK